MRNGGSGRAVENDKKKILVGNLLMFTIVNNVASDKVCVCMCVCTKKKYKIILYCARLGRGEDSNTRRLDLLVRWINVRVLQ